MYLRFIVNAVKGRIRVEGNCKLCSLNVADC